MDSLDLEKEENIDLGKLWQVTKAHKKVVGSIKNTKGTNLITVTAKGRTSEEAQKISKEVVDNFLTMQADNGLQSQNLLVQLFDERIEEAKRDYDDAAQKLADFSSKHGLYSLDGQL